MFVLMIHSNRIEQCLEITGEKNSDVADNTKSSKKTDQLHY